jgi:hypothetical protein
MRPLTLVGLALLVLGGFALFHGLSYTSQKSVLKVGDFNATMEERQTISPWVGAAAVVGGIVLLVAGSRRRG